MLLLVQHYVHHDQSSAFLGRGRNNLTYTETFKTLTLKNSARSAKFPSKGFENSQPAGCIMNLELLCRLPDVAMKMAKVWYPKTANRQFMG